MITRLGMAPRRAGMSVEAFQQHWRSTHADAALRIPNLRAYTQDHAVLDAAGRPLLAHPGFDACAETEFDDLASMDAGFASLAYQADVRADEDVLIDKPRFFMLLCQRVVLRPGDVPSDTVKLMTFMRFHPLSDRQKLFDMAAGPYAELVKASGALRHEQLVPDLQAHEGRQEPCCDLVDVVWFPGAERALAHANGNAQVDMLLAGRVFGRERLVATAHVVLPRKG